MLTSSERRPRATFGGRKRLDEHFDDPGRSGCQRERSWVTRRSQAIGAMVVAKSSRGYGVSPDTTARRPAEVVRLGAPAGHGLLSVRVPAVIAAL